MFIQIGTTALGIAFASSCICAFDINNFRLEKGEPQQRSCLTA